MRYNWLQIIAFGLLVVILAVLVPVTTVLNNRESDRKLDRPVTTNVSPFDITVTNGVSSFNGLVLLGNVSSIDPTAPSVKVHFSAVPVGTMSTASKNDDTGYNLLKESLRLMAGGQEFNLKGGAVVPAFDVVVQIAEGGTNRYPFDSYTTLMDVALYRGTSMNESVPLAIALVGAVQSWAVRIEAADLQELAGLVFFNLSLSRSWTTVLFSMLIIVTMWALSFCVFTLAVTLILRDRAVEPGTIAIAVALLFALPRLRDSQPNAPVVGGSSDVAGFLWNMPLAAVSCILLIGNYIVKYKREKRLPKAPVEPTTPSVVVASPR
ncbi:hypothetical protein HK105_203539 [Polyrhizophydium stewartii]|uniref:DUF4436 domain-containing protein n=1 Tax=Polyrhizophydium stewartii TaxID=2732419 RepID=A0ABR4NB43_9FUNG|nr:hypothetical protein HK105_004096 [Polyrhizophydium stewartii]